MSKQQFSIEEKKIQSHVNKKRLFFVSILIFLAFITHSISTFLYNKTLEQNKESAITIINYEIKEFLNQNKTHISYYELINKINGIPIINSVKEANEKEIQKYQKENKNKNKKNELNNFINFIKNSILKKKDNAFYVKINTKNKSVLLKIKLNTEKVENFFNAFETFMLITVIIMFFFFFISSDKEKEDFLNFFLIINELNKNFVPGKEKKISNNINIDSIINNPFYKDIYKNTLNKFAYINSQIYEISQKTKKLNSVKISEFLENDNNNNIYPLENISKSVNLLSNLFNFKNEIDRENKAIDILFRLSQILQKDLNLKYFVIFQINVFRQSKKIAILSPKLKREEVICNKNTFENIYGCKAIRSEKPVISDKKNKLCLSCNYSKFKKYENFFNVCIPFSVDKEIELLISIYLNKEEYNENQIEFLITQIKEYLNTLKPTLKALVLMEKLQMASLTDPMTGLYNRRYLEENIKMKLSEEYTIAMIDLDHFKQINDTFGHDNGDIVLKELAAFLKNFVQDKGEVIRFGGEEFVIYFPEKKVEDVYDLMLRIKENFSIKKFILNGNTITKTLSIGLSDKKQNEEKFFEEVIKEADIALYHSKNTGRNKITVYSESINKKNTKENTDSNILEKK